MPSWIGDEDDFHLTYDVCTMDSSLLCSSRYTLCTELACLLQEADSALATAFYQEAAQVEQSQKLNDAACQDQCWSDATSA